MCRAMHGCEEMKALILAAGRGDRMGDLAVRPKCLLPYNKEESLIQRLIRQLNKCNINDITVVIGYKEPEMSYALDGIKGVKTITNTVYNIDKNIFSMLKGIKEIDEDVIVLEADIIASDALIQYITGTDFENKSVWFTMGKITPTMTGGILKTDGKNNITDIKIIDEYDDKYKGYDKLTGLMRIARSELKTFKKYLDEYWVITLNQYYLVPWMEHLKELPCVKGDASHYMFSTFNTPEDYKRAIQKTYDEEPVEKQVSLVDVDKLYPVEDYDSKRLSYVEKHVIKKGNWVVPIKISSHYNTIMDGHHSLALAIKKGYKKVPVISFNYDSVKIFSLNEEIKVNKNILVSNALNGEILPYKTAKHILPPHKYKCKINLEKLK